MTGIALGHHVGRLEDGVGNLRNGETLVEGLLSRDDRSVGRQHEVNARVRNQVGLELRNINVERTIETERRGERRDDLSDEPVQVGVRRRLDVEVAAADIVEGFVVEAEGTVLCVDNRRP